MQKDPSLSGKDLFFPDRAGKPYILYILTKDFAPGHKLSCRMECFLLIFARREAIINQ